MSTPQALRASDTTLPPSPALPPRASEEATNTADPASPGDQAAAAGPKNPLRPTATFAAPASPRATVGDGPPLLFHAYEVQKGDTLSKIAGRFFGSPKMFDSLVRQNPQLMDPDFIAPGNIVLVAVASKAQPARTPRSSSETPPSKPDADLRAQAESEASLLKAQIAAAKSYASLRTVGILAVMAPGSYTEAGLDAVADWIKGTDRVTGEQDNPGWQLLKAIPGAGAMGVVVIWGGLIDLLDTVGQAAKSATGTAPDGSYLRGATLETTRDQLKETQKFIDLHPAGTKRSESP